MHSPPFPGPPARAVHATWVVTFPTCGYLCSYKAARTPFAAVPGWISHDSCSHYTAPTGSADKSEKSNFAALTSMTGPSRQASIPDTQREDRCSACPGHRLALMACTLVDN